MSSGYSLQLSHAHAPSVRCALRTRVGRTNGWVQGCSGTCLIVPTGYFPTGVSAPSPACLPPASCPPCPPVPGSANTEAGKGQKGSASSPGRRGGYRATCLVPYQPCASTLLTPSGPCPGPGGRENLPEATAPLLGMLPRHRAVCAIPGTFLHLLAAKLRTAAVGKVRIMKLNAILKERTKLEAQPSQTSASAAEPRSPGQQGSATKTGLHRRTRTQNQR